MTTAPFRFTITDGPSADRMVDSFKYAFSGEKIHVTFRLAMHGGRGSMTIETIVKSLGYESGAPGQLLFEADITQGGTGRISGYYNAQSREGRCQKVN